MMEATREGFQRTAHALDSDTLMVALNTENARRAQTAGWYTTAVLFRDMMGYFFAILQGFIIAITPLVAIMAFMPGMGLKMIGGYAKVLVWMTMWWPALAIVNFIMNSYYKSKLGGAGMLCSDAVAGCSSSIGLMSDATQNMMIAAGLMATFVPAIMWGIISQGSFALTSVLDRASGAGYATQAGGNIAHGSARFGDIGMNNVNMNKHDTTWQNSSGMRPGESHSGAGQHVTTQHQGGHGSTTAGAANRHDFSRSFANEILNSQKREQVYAQEASLASQKAIGDVASYGQQFSEDKSTSTDHSLMFSSEDEAKMALSTDTVLANQYREALDSGRMTAEEVTQQLKAQVGVNPRAAAIAGSIGGSYTSSSSFKETFNDTTGISYDYKDSDGSSRTVGSGARAGETASERRAIAEKEMKSWDARVSASVQNSFTASDKHAKQAALTEQLQARESLTQSMVGNRSISIEQLQDMENESQLFMAQIHQQQKEIEGDVSGGQALVEQGGVTLAKDVKTLGDGYKEGAAQQALDENAFHNVVDSTKERVGGRIDRAQALVAGSATGVGVENAMTALNEIGGLSLEQIEERMAENQEKIDIARDKYGRDVENNKISNAEQVLQLALFSQPAANEEFRGLLENRNALVSNFQTKADEIWAARDEAVASGTLPSIANGRASAQIDKASQDFQQQMREEFLEPVKGLGNKMGNGTNAGVARAALDSYIHAQDGAWARFTSEAKVYNEDLRGSRSGSNPMYHTGEKRNAYAAALAARTENTRLQAAAELLSGVQNFNLRSGRYQLEGVNNETGALVYSTTSINDKGEQVKQYYDRQNDPVKGLVFAPINESSVTHRDDIRAIADSKPDYRMDLDGDSDTAPMKPTPDRKITPP